MTDPDNAIAYAYADVIGRSEFEENHTSELLSGATPPWSKDHPMYRTYFRAGLRRAKALAAAGLLPTGIEWGHDCGGPRCEPDIPCTQSSDKTLMPDGNLFRRYTTGWYRIEGDQK